MMQIHIKSPTNIQELASFLERINRLPESHIGYCGVEKDEICDTLMNDFSDIEIDQSFAVACLGEDMVGALGLDIDLEDKSAEVWGPFIIADQLRVEIEKVLWDKLISRLENQVTRFFFFLNKKNEKGRQFVKRLGGNEKGKHLILKAYRYQMKHEDNSEIEHFSSSYWNSFRKLHEDSFPQTYYSDQDIINRLNEKNKLLLMKADDQSIKGYVYVEAEPEHKEGAIEFIAVADEHRNQGTSNSAI
ncbi:GNAT family N-acetyltransferase [Bacillus sp. FJAT-49705]|uniref:GNAT family N-acetyltransferase n=1 Tax=Cytobacillus citreus TaxID=2833586 RepID=A0ABS5P0G1_9BACI|nr:GNAT family N-acetyltransferase [Cytobacillus citreus]MBS4192679.1 GNAT family N-acetyltransferase [Cytobacillus citreus]